MPLFELPPEVCEKIYRFLSKNDLFMFALCSKECYKSVRHIIWKDLHIPWEILAEKSKLISYNPENLCLVKSIDFTICDLWDSIFDCNCIMQNDKCRASQWFCKLFNQEHVILFLRSLNGLESLKFSGYFCIDYFFLKNFKHFSQLKVINLADTRTDDSSLKIISENYLKLEKLNVDDCEFITEIGLKDFITSDVGLQLKELVCSRCMLKTIPSTNKEPCLQKLICQESYINDNSFENIGCFVNLEYLDISYNNITDLAFINISKLKKLEVLNVGVTDVTDKGVLVLKYLPSLKELYIAQNTEMTDNCWKYFQSFPSLLYVNLFATYLSLDGTENLRNAVGKKILIGCVDEINTDVTYGLSND